MKSNIKKRVLAVVLCMVLMLSTGIPDAEYWHIYYGRW